MEKIEYMNFPIQLLKDYLKDPRTALNNILEYCIVSLINAGIDTEDAKSTYNCGRLRPDGLQNGWDLYKAIPRNSPYTGFKINVFWDYYKNYKTPFEHAVLLAFLAMKSILGGESCCKKTTNIFIWSRMAGCVKAVSDERQLPSELQPFVTRYQFDKIKLALENGWHLAYYSNHMRGLYISFTMSINKLVEYAEDRKSTLQTQKKEHRMRVKNALDNLNKPP